MDNETPIIITFAILLLVLLITNEFDKYLLRKHFEEKINELKKDKQKWFNHYVIANNDFLKMIEKGATNKSNN